MNTRRAANRRSSAMNASGAEYAETGDVYGRPMAPPSGSLGKGVGYGTVGRGSMAGAGELPPKGPGRASTRVDASRRGQENAPTPGNPSGISTYKQGNPPPRGYRQ